MHIVHLIGSLERGGAELFLQRLCEQLAQREPRWTQSAWTIGARGELAAGFERAGIPVRAFAMRKSLSALTGSVGLVRALHASGASVLQTWMYHADAFGIAAYATGLRTPQVWSLRQSNLSAGVNRPETRALMRVCAAASSTVPAAIVAGSAAALDAHRARGYRAARMPVIRNGVDTERFRPSADLRAAARRAWGLDDRTLAIGYIARISPVKAHDVLLEAVAMLARAGDALPPWRLVLIGPGVSVDGGPLATRLAALGLGTRVVAPGPTDCPERVLPAFDIAVSSSLGEGFPNGLAEAMACGVAAVATDVGDTRVLVGDTGRLVPAASAPALADALAAALRESADERAARGRAARARIERQFQEADAVEAYAALYRSLAP